MDKRDSEILAAYRGRIKLFRRFGYDIPKARDYIVRKAGLTKGNILEIATGSGHMAIALAKRGIRCVSIDADKEALKKAYANLKALSLSRLVKLRHMDAGKLHFKDAAFDKIVSVNFIHHSKDPRKYIKEMVRIARQNIVIADFNRRGFSIADKVHRSEGNRHEESAVSLRDIKGFLDRLGLEVKVHRDRCQTVLVATKRRKT